jgi:predicted deacylase
MSSTFPSVPFTYSSSSSLYPSGEALIEMFRAAVARAGGVESAAGTSVEDRPLVRFDLGTEGRPTILMTALMHGVEVIGSMALLDLIERLADGSEPMRRLRTEAHLVVLPVVNPDAFFKNMDKVLRGKRAWQRCNANGVDLNRNFPRLTTKRLYHPFSGSRFKMSPHYLGPHSLSEPESRAVARIAHETRPMLSLAFHSFGNLALYPWAYTERENDRAAEYQKLGAALTGALSRPYRVHQARKLYSVLGDMDDWLDAEFGSLAFTIEVGRPDVRWRDGRNLTNPFRWMNPAGLRETVDNVTPGIVALASSALGFSSPAVRSSSSRLALPLDFAAK